ncbi:MAG: HEAT repeat domain-containing protein [Planctomycetaceae bacterium]|nr:HEAT repeat domain-containing protein [Planctomycetaceae bacterium]
MSQIPPARDSRTADDALPPVEPPSAGFILQLFVVPAVIVVIIVLVWLMFNWLAHMGSDPQDYVSALRRGNVARWQAAVNLANAMRSNAKLKQDAALAQELAQLLENELQTPGEPSANDIQTQAYLCKALGEFEIPAGLPALLKAADPRTAVQVRRAALEAIALLAANAGREQTVSDPQLLPALLTAAADEESGIREAAAYTLGVVGGPEATSRLHALVNDAVPNVRYNAATGLARRGDPAAIPVLVEMLDPDEKAGIATETDADSQEFKRQSILTNALRATTQLATANPTADLQPLATAVEKLVNSSAPEKIRIAARDEVLAGLKRRGQQP